MARPAVVGDFRTLGTALSWHGSFSADYFWDENLGAASYIDANPRITEPMNAYVNGVDLAGLQVELSLNEQPRRRSLTAAARH